MQNKIENLRKILEDRATVCVTAEMALAESVEKALAAQDAFSKAEAEAEKAAIQILVEMALIPPTRDLLVIREIAQNICNKVRHNRTMREMAEKAFGAENNGEK